MLLGYLKVEYEFIPANKETWAADQQAWIEGGFHFPNLPMIEDGDFKLSETDSIVQYIAEKYGDGTLCGKDTVDKALVLQTQGVVHDLFWALAPAVYSPEYKTKIAEGVKDGSKVEQKIRRVETYLEGKDFLVGYFTYADLNLAMTFFMFSNMFQSAEIENPMNTQILYDHAVRVFGLPGIKEWFECDQFRNQAVPIPWIKMCDLVNPSA